MIRVGLTGGLATGKSFVGRTLESLGCYLVRADDLGHQVLAPGGEAYHTVVEQFGRAILDENGIIDRRRLAAEVFGSNERLALLNSVVHPLVFKLEEEFFARVAREDPSGIAVVEAAILIETGSYRRFDKLIVVVCTEGQQIKRAMERDGSTEEEVRSRIRRQMPLEEKRKYADYVIDTSGTKENTVEQTKAVYDFLRSLCV
jgi:dephospho-CoA kinase